MRKFTPTGKGITVSLAVTASSDKAKFDSVLGGQKSQAVRLFNAGPSTVFFELVGSQGDQTASVATGVPLAAGATEVFSNPAATFVAAITASGTATLYVTPGEGG